MVTFVRVAAERLDVVAHPAQRLGLIEQALVAGCRNAPAGQLVQMEEAQRPDAIVDGDDHAVAALGERGAIVDGRTPRAADEGAAVNPHQHRALAGIDAGREDVELQAVLVAIGGVAGVEHERHHAGVLHRLLPRLLAPLRCRTNARPGQRRLRRLPAPLAGGRGGERHALEGMDAFVVSAFYLSVARLDDCQSTPPSCHAPPGGVYDKSGLSPGNAGVSPACRRDACAPKPPPT